MEHQTMWTKQEFYVQQKYKEENVNPFSKLDTSTPLVTDGKIQQAQYQSGSSWNQQHHQSTRAID